MKHDFFADGPLDEARIRRWAYDPDADLVGQDDDLLLHNWKFSAVLLAAAADPECPQGELIFNIWDDFTQNRTIHRQDTDISAAYKAMEIAATHAGVEIIDKWIAVQKLRLSYVEGIGPVDEAQALQMARVLMAGPDRPCSVAVCRETDDSFWIERGFPLGEHGSWLAIDKTTGKFRYAHHWPKGALAPQWFY